MDWWYFWLPVRVALNCLLEEFVGWVLLTATIILALSYCMIFITRYGGRSAKIIEMLVKGSLICSLVLAPVTVILRMNGIFSAFALLQFIFSLSYLRLPECTAWTTAFFVGVFCIFLSLCLNDFTSASELKKFTRWLIFVVLSACAGYNLSVFSLIWVDCTPGVWPLYIVNFVFAMLSACNALLRVGLFDLPVASPKVSSKPQFAHS